MNKKCNNCNQLKTCKDTTASWIFFIIGLIATIAMRIVTVLMSINPVYGKISWYIGISGFFMFFIYKFNITQARSSLINKQNIMNNINQEKELTKEDYKLLRGILCSLNSKKERINYLFIFALSALALIVAVYVDFFR